MTQTAFHLYMLSSRIYRSRTHARLPNSSYPTRVSWSCTDLTYALPFPDRPGHYEGHETKRPSLSRGGPVPQRWRENHHGVWTEYWRDTVIPHSRYAMSD